MMQKYEGDESPLANGVQMFKTKRTSTGRFKGASQRFSKCAPSNRAARGWACGRRVLYCIFSLYTLCAPKQPYWVIGPNSFSETPETLAFFETQNHFSKLKTPSSTVIWFTLHQSIRNCPVLRNGLVEISTLGQWKNALHSYNIPGMCGKFGLRNDWSKRLLGFESECNRKVPNIGTLNIINIVFFWFYDVLIVSLLKEKGITALMPPPNTHITPPPPPVEDYQVGTGLHGLMGWPF